MGLALKVTVCIPERREESAYRRHGRRCRWRSSAKVCAIKRPAGDLGPCSLQPSIALPTFPTSGRLLFDYDTVL